MQNILDQAYAALEPIEKTIKAAVRASSTLQRALRQAEDGLPLVPPGRWTGAGERRIWAVRTANWKRLKATGVEFVKEPKDYGELSMERPALNNLPIVDSHLDLAENVTLLYDICHTFS